MVAEVLIETSVKNLNKTFDYQIPIELVNKIKIGTRVNVPFGNQKNLEDGIVIGIKEKSEYKVKNIASIQKEQIKDEYIKLAKWMGNRYFCNTADCLRLMLPPGRTTKNVNNRVKERTITIYNLNNFKDEKNIENILNDKKIIRTEKQKNVIEFLMNNNDVTMEDITLFTDAKKSTIDTLVKKEIIIKKEINEFRNPFLHKVKEKTKDLKLTDEQQIAINSIDVNSNNEYLIYGVTGSGKTEIYMQLIERMLKENKSSIVLVPEISLTPQTIDRFIGRFSEENIAVLHSKLSIGERYDEWNKIKDGRAKIIIGARSAIFAPCTNLGMIIIDEEHDESYQSESNPRYDALEVAEFLKDEFNIPLILGSATPDMKTFYKAKNNKIKLLTLTKRANESTLPDVKIIDLRNELAHNNKSMISFKLKEEIEKNLHDKKQTILFFNRRGFSSFLMCKDCGHTFKCKRCNITLTYHKNENILKCHYCGYEEKVPKICPKCNSTNISYVGAGTQKLEEEVKTMFKNATTIRMDVDTVSKKNSHEEILNKFKNENIDILIGTQMVVKGHHFPNVTLVGAIFADTDLNIGDFRASERTFQTLTQVSGRAGREKDKGRVIIQTFNPENYAIEFAKTQNFDLFYNTEIEIRKQLKYPPFCDIIVIGLSSKNNEQLKIASKKIHSYLKDRVINEKFGLLLYSPVPCPINKIKDRYRMRIIIKCIYDDRVHDLLSDSLNEFQRLKLDKETRISIQINPNNMM